MAIRTHQTVSATIGDEEVGIHEQFFASSSQTELVDFDVDRILVTWKDTKIKWKSKEKLSRLFRIN